MAKSKAAKAPDPIPEPSVFDKLREEVKAIPAPKGKQAAQDHKTAQDLTVAGLTNLEQAIKRMKGE